MYPRTCCLAYAQVNTCFYTNTTLVILTCLSYELGSLYPIKPTAVRKHWTLKSCEHYLSFAYSNFDRSAVLLKAIQSSLWFSLLYLNAGGTDSISIKKHWGLRTHFTSHWQTLTHRFTCVLLDHPSHLQQIARDWDKASYMTCVFYLLDWDLRPPVLFVCVSMLF